MLPRARAIGRPTTAHDELEARLELPDTPPPGDHTERGPIELVPYALTPDTVRLPPQARHRAEEETQQLGPEWRGQMGASTPDAERTVSRMPRLVDPGPQYEEPLSGWMLQLIGWTALGVVLGAGLLLALWVVF